MAIFSHFLDVWDRSQMTSAKRGEGVSQKLTKVDKKGWVGFSQKLMSANYQIYSPLGAFLALFERAPKLTKNGHFQKLYFFQFSFVIHGAQKYANSFRTVVAIVNRTSGTRVGFLRFSLAGLSVS